MKRIAFIVAVVALALLATALPFLPGRYDGLAAPVSGIARGLGMVSLLLVPIGVVWLLFEWRRSDGVQRGRVAFVVATLVAGSIGVLAAALMAFTFSGAVLAAALVTAWGLVLWRRGPRLLVWARHPRRRDVAPALALILVPSVVAGTQFAFAQSLTTFAWTRTMDGVAPLIADIERYRATNGHYPRSLVSEWRDYRPEIMGVSGYQYDPAGDAYNLAIEVPTFSIDSREFLLFNPADTHAMASHDAHLLLPTAAERGQYRGYSSARYLNRPHWKVLSFD